ncbi:citrate/2-methylcitrate synthase [Senegalimassilia anaerobia]|uniref:citrate/2-methylcitrate synthase n=1 Tax=Senegalimassilia anaerobia TaxID=1473216 RepID=UPI003A926872
MQQVEQLTAEATPYYQIAQELYMQYEVKRGLRDLDGKGVRAGLTTISQVSSTKQENGRAVPAEGKLFYRGISIDQLVQGFITHDRFGYEEIAYLLLMGRLPKEAEMREFHQLLTHYQPLPNHFNSGVIMKMPSDNIMNTMAKCVLALHAYDPRPDDTSLPNVMRQCLQLIAQFPSLAVFGYQASMYFRNDKSMFIQKPDPSLSAAENILYMMRPDGKYTRLEARLLDLCLVLHAEHGGGNNSSFTTHVLTSADTDAYSTYAAAIGSLKGRKHGGANHQVLAMQKEIKDNVVNWENDDEVAAYLAKIVNKQAYDKSGLVYGMGHAVYTLSDPRAVICKRFAEKLAIGTEFEAEFRLLEKIERLAPEVILNEKGTRKDMCANVDMYSGFVYSMLGIPEDLFTPLFACARMSGWAAHRFEEIVSGKRIIRPAYKSIYSKKRAYIPMDER